MVDRDRKTFTLVGFIVCLVLVLGIVISGQALIIMGEEDAKLKKENEILKKAMDISIVKGIGQCHGNTKA